MMYNRILVPIEDARQSETAMTYAAEVASHFSSSLTLLHVIHPVHPMDAPMFFGTGIPSDTGEEDIPEMVQETEREKVAEARLLLADKVRELKERGMEASSIVVIGQAAKSILHVADSEHSNLIVLSSSGHHRLKRILNGDVVDEVIRKSKVPVLVIPESSGETP